MTYNYDTHARGVSDGWDAANFAEAYGNTETPEIEATRRAAELAAATPGFDTSAYETGFADGWQNYHDEQGIDHGTGTNRL